MAFINDTQFFLKDEEVSRGVEVTNRPVESGLDLTDNIRRNPITISITGEIVGENAASDLSTLQTLHHRGKLVKYLGRNFITNAVIEDFNTSHPIDIYGGCAFDMTLREIRIARPAYVAKTAKATKSGTQQVKRNTSTTKHIVKKGDSLWNIAKAYYGDGSLYLKIYVKNKKIIGASPSMLKIGLVLEIPN